MGFLDRLKSLVSGGDPAAALRGPLDLGPGDGVSYYRERFAVAAVRRLAFANRRVWHYCVRSADGGSAVLVLEESPEPVLWLQRPCAPGAGDAPEAADGGPWRLVAQGQAQSAQTGDADTLRARAVAVREYADAEGDRRLVVEDWGGVREVRVGDSVHEAEVTLHRDAAPRADDGGFDAAAEEHAARGTPEAAAAALLAETGEPPAPREEPVVREDVDPTAFDDESWDDEDIAEPAAAVAAAAAARVVEDSEDDEWREASRWIRDNGLPPDPRKR